MSDLLVRMRLDDKGLDAQLKNVSSKFADAAKGISRIALPVAAIAGIAKAVDGLAAIGEAAINTIAPLHDTAQQLGVTAERLQELRAVAGAAGVGVEQFDKALSTLNRTLGQASVGQGEFEKIAQSVGIELRDAQGHIKTTGEVWDALTEKIQSGALSQNAAIGVAAAAFGRDGAKMVQVLRQTAEEQQRVIETARQFGAIISNEVVAAADEYEDKLSLIKQGTEALDAQNKLILAPLTLKWAELKNEISGAVTELARAVGLVDDNAILMQRRLRDVEETMERVREALRIGGVENPEEHPTLLIWKRQADELREALNYEELLKTPFMPERRTDDVIVDPEEQAKATKAAADAELALVTAVYAEKDRLAQLEIEQAREYATILAEEQERVKVEELEHLKEWQQVLYEERERAANMELEQYIEKEGLLTQARKEGVEARRRLDNMEAGQRVATTLSALEQITAGVAQHSKKAFQLNKLAAIANAIINTAQGATKALAQGGFAGIAMAAAVIAAGAAQIAAIKRTTFEGGGGGTTPSAAGRTPTVNGQPVQQERVIIARGINPNDIFSGRQLVEILNEATKDGAKLVLAT